KFTWTANVNSLAAAQADSTKKKPAAKLGAVTFPFTPYGWTEAPKQETILFKNATVWTNEAEGKLENADVLIKAGKIAGVGKGLQDATAKVCYEELIEKYPGSTFVNNARLFLNKK
ncbi:MAG: hypothetical protein EBR55_09775, partial [Chitinophagia bacterium]|nr:hypothetical protein [Chitinophagia bacterium]